MYAGLYDNRRTETKYYFTDNDTQLNQKGFWSLTMYDRQHFFYANDLNRYSLGTKNAETLKYDPDGGPTLYLGNNSLGEDKEANWIPAPADEFSLGLRAYWPEQAMLDGSWKPPAINKIQ